MPLQNDFEPPIIQFIQQLRASGFTMMENPLSTQIYGEYDALMSFLTQDIKTTFAKEDNVVLNMKIVKSDRSNYERNY